MRNWLLKKRHKKWVSYLYRTATTTYPCCLPTLGDSVGAGRIRLTRGKGNNSNELGANKLKINIAVPLSFSIFVQMHKVLELCINS